MDRQLSSDDLIKAAKLFRESSRHERFVYIDQAELALAAEDLRKWVESTGVPIYYSDSIQIDDKETDATTSN